MNASGRLDHLVEIATTLRVALEPGFQLDDEGRPVSSGTCLHASVLLAGFISRFAGGRGRVVGGDGDLGEGGKTRDGVAIGHYWAEASFDDGEVYFLDITSDQLGYPKVVVGLEAELRERYVVGRQDIVDDAALDLAGELGCRDLLVHQLRA